MFTRIFIPLTILLSLIIGIVGSLYYFKDSLPSTFNLFGPSEQKEVYILNSINVPVIFRGTIYKYVYFNVDFSFPSNRYFLRLDNLQPQLRDLIIRDVYFFTSSRPPAAPITPSIIQNRIAPLLLNYLGNELQFEDQPIIEVNTLFERENAAQ